VRTALVQGLGVLATLVYGAFIAWIYASQPRTLQEVATGAQVAAGVYEVDAARFQAGRQLFRREQFRAARDEWARADPAQRDPRTQFYVAYSFYREGWGRFYHDDVLYRQGVAAAARAMALSPQAYVADDPSLGLRTAAELKAELEKGTEQTWSDLSPLRVLEPRK
jgi:hypothetical protein